MSNNLTQIHLGVAATAAVQGCKPVLANLGAFATKCDELVEAKGDRVFVPVFSAVEASNFNEASNNYGAADGDISGVPVVLSSHLKATLGASDIELQTTALKSLYDASGAYGKSIALGVLGEVYSKVNKTNFAASHLMDGSAAETEAAWFGLYGAAVEQGLDPSECTLTLAPAYYAKLLSFNKFSSSGDPASVRMGKILSWVGFKDVFCASNLPAGNLAGFISHKSALAVATASIRPASGSVDYMVVPDEESGVSVGVRANYDGDKGRLFLTYETLCGSAVCRGDSLIRIVSSAD